MAASNTYLRNLWAAATNKVPENLISFDQFSAMLSGPEDAIIQNKGIAAYRYMFRDSEVSADIGHCKTLMIPGWQMKPPDTSDEAIKSAQFCTDIFNRMPGSFLSVLRDNVLGEGLVAGFSVTEPVYDTIELPDWGTVIGLQALKQKPSESFIDGGIERDKYGNITLFKQTSGERALPEDVIFFAYQGSPNRTYGLSILHPVYDPWKGKQKLGRIYLVFCATNASGLRIAQVKGEDASDESKMTDANTTMRTIAEMASIAVPENWDLKIQIPPGTAGMHFLRGIEHYNKEIRKGILGDENYNAQGDVGAYASRKASLSITQETLITRGVAFCETVSEQLCRQVLDRNGYERWPTPMIIPEPQLRTDASPAEAIAALGEARTSGVFRMDLPQNVELELTRRVLTPIGVEVENLEERPEPQAQPGAESSVAPIPAPVVAAQEHRILYAAAAPPGRQLKDLKRNDKQYTSMLDSSVDSLTATWSELWPQIESKLEGLVFNPGGNGWKLKSSMDVRKAVEEAASYKRSVLRRDLETSLIDGWNLGTKHAQSMVGIQAAVSMVPAPMGAGAAETELRNRVYFILKQKYAGTEEDIYFQLVNGIRGGMSPQQVSAGLREYLESRGVAGSYHASTIVNTSLSTAYNGARMNLFNSLADPTSGMPGGITGYVFSAVMDERTTDVCLDYDGMAFAVDDPYLPQPPLHYACRSQLIPVFTGETPWSESGAYTDLGESQKLAADIPAGFGGN